MKFSEYMKLTEEERRVCDALTDLKPKDGWTYAIDYILKKKGADKFREMIDCLFSQWENNPELMQKILGKRALEGVLSLKKLEVA